MSNQIDAPPLNEDELNEIYNWVFLFKFLDLFI
jgi:hypothetical protein